MKVHINLFVILTSIEPKNHHHVIFSVTNRWNYEHYENNANESISNPSKIVWMYGVI
jgi:hypothetical protein